MPCLSLTASKLQLQFVSNRRSSAVDRSGELYLFLNMSCAPHPSLGDVREYLNTELGFIIGRCFWQMGSGGQGCHLVSSCTSLYRTIPQRRTDSSTEMGKPRLNCNLSVEPDALRLICPLVLLSEVSLFLSWCPGV